jgi:hypothetical protein
MSRSARILMEGWVRVPGDAFWHFNWQGRDLPPKRCGEQDQGCCGCAPRRRISSSWPAPTPPPSHGFEAAVERAQRFAEAGADILFVEAVTTARRDPRPAPAPGTPQLMNMVIGGKTPITSAEELASLAIGLVLYANAALQGAVAGMQTALGVLRDDKEILESSGLVTPFAERQRLVGKAGLGRARAALYLIAADCRVIEPGNPEIDPRFRRRTNSFSPERVSPGPGFVRLFYSPLPNGISHSEGGGCLYWD